MMRQKVTVGKEHDYLRTTLSMIRNLRSQGSKQDFLDNVVRLIQRESNCECVGIRVLDENGYIPYQSYVGFSREFWEAENMIQVSKEDCGCARLIAGKLLPCDHLFVNQSGSLCLNDSLAVIESLSESEKASYRGSCIKAGYRSIAIVPILYRGDILGVIHLADLLADQINPKTIKFVEEIAPLIGGVLIEDKIAQSLKNSRDNQDILKSIVNGISSLAYVIDLENYELIYSSKDMDEVYGYEICKCYEIFSRSVPCPDCPKQPCNVENKEFFTWERYDKKHDRHFLAEQKIINLGNGREINVAFVTNITRVKKTEKILSDINAELEVKVRQLQELSASLEEEIMERKVVQLELARQKDDMQKIAYYDGLTGLPNRVHVSERLKLEIEKSIKDNSAGAVMFVDLDDLKFVNDSFGHTRGDAVIILAGAYLLAEAGEGAFVARIGGDEFIVIFPGTNGRIRIAELADRIIGALYQEYETSGVRFQLSASIGITMYPDDGTTVEEIFKNADSAMYVAKKSGKNCWRFYENSMHKDAYERMLLINSLRHAVGRGELLIHYQPQVRTQEGNLVGFEALLRWNSPEHGLISPGKFIPLAEQSRIIGKIGNWVLGEACQFARRLSDKGRSDIYVAVNVSPYQLKNTDFLPSVQKALQDAGIRASQLELEITESALIDSLEEIILKLKELRRMGVRLSLDDFGTGYSSLTHIQRLPLNTLKIDKAFIDMIEMDGAQKTIIKTIVDMGHIMNMTVIAEGVETKQQLDYLSWCQCDGIQGYIISRPVVEEDAIHFLFGNDQ